VPLCLELSCIYRGVKAGRVSLDFNHKSCGVNGTVIYVIRIQIRLVRSSPPSHEFEQTTQQAYEVYRKYQMAVHGDPPDKCTLRHYTRFLVNSPLQVNFILQPA
jgi:hypothetical protein